MLKTFFVIECSILVHTYVLAQCENQSRKTELMMRLTMNPSQYGQDSLQKTDSAIYIHDDHLYLERVAALTTISFKENGYQSCHVTKIKRVIHG